MNYEDIRRLQLGQLRTAMPVRLLRPVQSIAPNGQTLTLAAMPATSPFYFTLDQTTAIIASKTTAQLEDALSELTAASSAFAMREDSATLRPAAAGVRVQVALPEMLFQTLYGDLEPKQSYIEFRNAIYLQVATNLQRVLPALLRELGTVAAEVNPHDFTNLTTYLRKAQVSGIGVVIGRIELQGQQLGERGIMGFEIDLPQIVGRDVTALRLVRDTVWGALSPNLNAQDMLSTLKEILAADGAGPTELDWVLDFAQNNTHALLPGFDDQSMHVQLLLRAALNRGSDIELNLRSAGMFTVKLGTQSAQIVDRTTDLNTAASVQVATNPTVRKMRLGTARLPVPAGARYTTLGAAQEDFARSFAHKSLAVKGETPGTTQLFPIPARAEDFTASVQERLTKTGAANVEMFVPGDQFSVLVLDGRVLAVSARDFAYVVGDGRRTFAQLLAQRAKTRTENGLPNLARAMITERDLADQGVTDTTVVPRGSQVYLGRNSQSSAAGMRQDGRALLDESYDQVAIAAAAALDLRYCSVQMIVGNGYVPYDETSENHGNALATIVGVDATPDLSEFERPTYGAGVKVAGEVLTAMLNS